MKRGPRDVIVRCIFILATTQLDLWRGARRARDRSLRKFSEKVIQMSLISNRNRRWTVVVGLTGLTCLACLGSEPTKSRNSWSFPEVAQSCGPRDVMLDVRQTDGAGRPSKQPASGESLVYVVQDVQEQVPANSSLVTRFGVDGRWVGANRGRSYFYMELQPGTHHLCVSGQWTRLRSENSIALRRIIMDNGQVYYVRVRFLYPAEGGISLGLETVDEDEGRFLVDSSAYSESHPQ